MSFALIIFIRILFVACMVFIIGYIFGSFAKRPVLKTLSRVAAILIIPLFIALNILFVCAAIHGRWHRGPWGHDGRHHGYEAGQQECHFPHKGRETGQDSIPEQDHASPGNPGAGAGADAGAGAGERAQQGGAGAAFTLVP